MGIGYNTSIVRDGLVSYLDAANPKSYPGTGTTWFNLINSNFGATLYNSPTHNALEGFISFDGVNQFAVHSVQSLNTGNGTMFSFELWFKIRQLPTAEYAANGHIWGGRNGDNVVMYVNPSISGVSQLNLIYDDSRYTTSAGHQTNGGIEANQWVQWVCIGDGTTNTISHYINGKLNRDFTPVVASQQVRNWNGTSRIANDTRWNTFTQLDVAVLKQYNKKLTGSEVELAFEALRGRFGI